MACMLPGLVTPPDKHTEMTGKVGNESMQYKSAGKELLAGTQSCTLLEMHQMSEKYETKRNVVFIKELKSANSYYSIVKHH